jgi:type II secretory pathway pseudopilin PulG
MANLDGWDMALLAVAAYIAVVSLVRLMRARRRAVVAELQREVLRQQAQAQAAEHERQRRGAPKEERSENAA